MQFKKPDNKYLSFYDHNESKIKNDSISSKFSQDGSSNSTKYQFNVKDYK